MKETINYTINPNDVNIINLLEYMKSNLSFENFYILCNLMNSELTKTYYIQKQMSERGEILSIKEVEE